MKAHWIHLVWLILILIYVSTSAIGQTCTQSLNQVVCDNGDRYTQNMNQSYNSDDTVYTSNRNQIIVNDIEDENVH